MRQHDIGEYPTNWNEIARALVPPDDCGGQCNPLAPDAPDPSKAALDYAAALDELNRITKLP